MSERAFYRSRQMAVAALSIGALLGGTAVVDAAPVASTPTASPNAPTTAPLPPTSPPTTAMTADNADTRIRIQLVSRDQVDVSSEISAKVAALPFRDGDAFRAGQTLVVLDCSLFIAQLHKAQADVYGAGELLDVNRKLLALHSIGELDVREAEAKQRASAADVAYMQTTTHKCTITAPFDGRVSKRSASPQQFAEPGKPLLTVIDTSHLELKMIVPSKWLMWLRPGHALSVQVDEVGKTYPAKVARIGAHVDPVTQTVDVTASLDANAAELLPGMSGWATFAR